VELGKPKWTQLSRVSGADIKELLLIARNSKEVDALLERER
jgi:hypothetical protein